MFLAVFASTNLTLHFWLTVSRAGMLFLPDTSAEKKQMERVSLPAQCLKDTSPSCYVKGNIAIFSQFLHFLNSDGFHIELEEKEVD